MKNTHDRTQKTATAKPDASTGPDGTSIAPPAYGIEHLDLVASVTSHPLQLKADVSVGGASGQPSANNTGLPDGLKAGVEALSGFSLDSVRVHFNSSKPAQLQALAYAQGSDIHVAPGQERHLPHEAWHIVQQKQGRVQATMQLKEGIAVNDDKGLEHEADMMSAKALQKQGRGASPFQWMDHRPEAKQAAPLQAMANNHSDAVIQRKPLNARMLNVAGENHDTSDGLRMWEAEYANKEAGGPYWQENEFKINVAKPGSQTGETVSTFGDPKILQMANIIYLSTNALANITKFLKDLEPVKVIKSNLAISRMKVFGKCDSIKLYLPTIKAIGNAYKKLKREAQVELPNRPDLKTTYDFYSEFGDVFYDNFGAGIDQWVSNTLRLNRTTANEVQLNLAVKNAIELLPIGSKLLNDIFKKDSVSFGENQLEMQKVIFIRSQAMHDAAVVGRTSKGVWKIGDTHVKDIKEILQGASPGYELLTEDEFLEGLATWLPQYPVYQGFEYGMELADIYDWSERTVFEMAKAGQFDDMVQVRKNHKDDGHPSYIS